jgi:hypothetical protein
MMSPPEPYSRARGGIVASDAGSLASKHERSARRGLLRPWLFLCVLLVVGIVAIEAGHVLWNGNVHTLIPGQVYRCSQQSPEGLKRLVERYGIQTVVNLRGCCEGFAWYEGECRATQDLDINQEDISMSAGRLPSPQSVRRLIDVLDHGRYPILLHCRRGADRTGLAAVAVLLLETETSQTDARRQLGLRFGHFALGRPAQLDRFYDLYGEWLCCKHRSHTPTAFRHWATQEYAAGGSTGRLEWVETPTAQPANEPFPLRVRARNISTHAWRMSPFLTAGIHLSFLVWDERGEQVAGGRAGHFEAEVAPGEAVDVTVPLPALHRPGRYRVFVDLIDEQRCLFYQTGSEPLEGEILVRG